MVEEDPVILSLSGLQQEWVNLRDLTFGMSLTLNSMTIASVNVTTCQNMEKYQIRRF